MVGGVEGRAVDLDGRRAPHVDRDHRGNDVEALDRHDDRYRHLRVDVGAVRGRGAHRGGAAAQTGDGGGAVAVVKDADIVVVHAPVERLGDVVGGAVVVVGHGLHAQRLANAHLGLVRVDEGKFDLAHGDGDVDDARGLQTVVGSGGDGGRAFADAGDGAVLGDSGDGFIAGFPGEVGGGVERGVAGTAIDQQLDGAAGVDGCGGRHHPALLNGHDDAHVDLGADAGAVGGDGGNLDGAGPVAGHGGGAVAVVADAGIAGVAHAPVERLSNGSGGAVRADGGGGEGQIAVADGDHGLTAAKDADVDVVGADADGDGAALLNAVVGSDGDGRRAFADAGNDAGLADGGDGFIAGFPGEVPRGVVGGVEGRAVDLDGRRVPHADVHSRRDDVEALDRNDDVHLHLGVDAGTVGGKSADGDRTGAQARDGDGAVEVFDDAGIAGVAHAPLHVLRYIDGGTIFIVGHGAHDQARTADADLRPLGIDQFQLDLAHGNGDADSADSLQAVVRNGGDGGGALANAGDHAGFVDDNHVFIAGFPREVGGGMERGVGRRAVGA